MGLLSTLQESVTKIRFEALRIYFRATRYVQISELVGITLFFSFSLVLWDGHPVGPLDHVLGNNLLAVLFFAIYVGLTIVALSFKGANLTEKRLGYSVYASFFAWIFGFIGLLGSSSVDFEVMYLPAYTGAIIVMFLPALLRSMPMVDFANRRHRNAPPGQYGNLNGMNAEIILESRNTLRIKYTFVIGFAFVALLLGGVARVMARSTVTDWTSFFLIAGVSILATLPAAAGVSFLIVRSPGNSVLDTYERGKLWYYNSEEKLANFFVVPRSAREVNGRAIVFNTLHSARVRLRPRNESELAILLSMLGPGQKDTGLPGKILQQRTVIF